MTTAMMTAPTETITLPAPIVTAEQRELIKRTVAQGATEDELQLYLYDCARQGVHPLDRLIHFTKRKQKDGTYKYTPITSIDLMRTRAADTGEYAGSDDAMFLGEPKTNEFAATVRVWRFVQGQRCSFTATARWSEYKPSDDFMWNKMPHTMLSKTAEALALRKGFPRQLAGLYAKEELDQAGSGDSPSSTPPRQMQTDAPGEVLSDARQLPAPGYPDAFESSSDGDPAVNAHPVTRPLATRSEPAQPSRTGQVEGVLVHMEKTRVTDLWIAKFSEKVQANDGSWQQSATTFNKALLKTLQDAEMRGARIRPTIEVRPPSESGRPGYNIVAATVL